MDALGKICSTRGRMLRHRFGIREGGVGDWSVGVDTALPSPDDIAEPDLERVPNSATYRVQRRSVVALVRE